MKGNGGIPSRLTANIRRKWWPSSGKREPVLVDVGISLNGGQTLSVMGLSGIGKSALLLTLAGLDSNFEGSVIVDGRDIQAGSGDVQLVFQDNRLFEWMTAVENVCFAFDNVDEEAQSIAFEWLERFGLSARVKAYPRDLSEGQKKRVALARALVRPPKVLLLDEPLSGLDPHNQALITNEILRLQRDAGLSCVVTTHDPLEAISLSQRALFLSGTPATVGSELSLDGVSADPSRIAAVADEIRRRLGG